MKINPPESSRRSSTAARKRRLQYPAATPLPSYSGERSGESYHPHVTVKLHCERFKYELLSEERKTLNTSSWLTFVPRRPRSKPKVANKLIVIMGDIAEGISDQCPCPESTSRPRAHRKSRKHKTKQKDDECSDSEEVIPRHRKSRKRKTKQKYDECSDSEEVIPRRIHIRGQVKRSWNKSITTTDGRGKLDSSTCLRYLMHIWSELPEEKVKSATYFDPLWMDWYTNEKHSAMVLNWIKEKDIFSKKYVFVPIVMWSHWSLLIFCHLGESLDSKTNSPCMLLLDSLHAIGPTRLEPVIRRLLYDVYRLEDRLETVKQLKKMRLLIPKVPQQKKGDECGFYILLYIKLFLENAPENFDISAGYPYFMKKDWFSAEEMESFCRKLEDDAPVVLSSDVDEDDCVCLESGDVELIGISAA